MVLQIGANAGQVVHHFHAVLFQTVGGPNARELQNLSRADAACTQRHFARGSGGDQLMTVPHLHASASFAAIGIGFNDQFGDLCLCPKLKVGAAITSGS